MGPGQLASNSSRLDGHSLHFQTIRRRNHRSGRGYALSDLSGLIRIPLLKHRRVDPVCGRSRGPWLRSGRGSPPRKAAHFPPCGPLSPRAAGTGLLGSAPDRLHLPRPLGTRNTSIPSGEVARREFRHDTCRSQEHPRRSSLGRLPPSRSAALRPPSHGRDRRRRSVSRHRTPQDSRSRSRPGPSARARRPRWPRRAPRRRPRPPRAPSPPRTTP